MSLSPDKKRSDPTEEAAAIRRLSTAADRNEDRVTGDVAVSKAVRLGLEMGFNPFNSTAAKILGIDKVSKINP